VNDARRMDVVKATQEIVNNRLNMVLGNDCLYDHHRQQVSSLSFKNVKKILERLWVSRRLQHIVKFYHVSVSAHLPQNLYFSQQSFSIGLVLKNVANLLDGDILASG
jgi:hypothetical protein